jgi:tetratricopeptide (TPR) repeat protein
MRSNGLQFDQRPNHFFPNEFHGLQKHLHAYPDECVSHLRGLPMVERTALVLVVGLTLMTAQTETDSNVAYKRFEAAKSTPDALTAATEWIQIYERQPPSPKNIPPYLPLARFYVDHGIRLDDVPTLLTKATLEITTVGGFTYTRARSASPFEDDITRSLAAVVYIKLGLTPQAQSLLDTVKQTLSVTNPTNLDPSKARLFAHLLYSYRDALSRLAIAQGRYEDALSIEQQLLRNTKGIAPQLIDEHCTLALTAWKALGRSDADFNEWLSKVRL